MRLAVSAAAAVAALTMTASAGAHLYRPGCNQKLPPRAELACARLNRQHALATLRWARAAQRKIRLLDATSALVVGRVVQDHRWLYRTMTARVREAERRILAASRPAHYALWMCIHGDPAYRHAPGGEGAWGAVGHGEAVGHYNGLQMTYNWLGIVPGNPNDYSPAQILRYAEQGYAASGYSRAWLSGQWGATIGPCWQYAD